MSSSTNRPASSSSDPNRHVDETIDFGSTQNNDRIGSDSAPPIVDVDNPDGKQFGHYTLLEEIARGGMGVVYKARDNKLNRIVAVKMILSGRFASENDVRRFQQEAAAAANLDHPGIVPIYEIGEQEGHHFFSMKLVEGGSLDSHLPTIREDQRACADLIAKIARAVHHAHQRGILHRDVKPANILMDTDGTPLVSDLGLAKDTKTESGITHTGAVVGTPGYMPPEQIKGSKEVTTAADIYSIGAMLYEALTGRPPHKGDSVMDTLRKVVEEEPATPRSITGTVNRVLQMICLKCLRKDPNQRYASAAELADDLESWLAGERVSVRPPSWSSTVGELLLSNLRSAIGAVVVGAVFGWLAGYFLAYLSTSNDVLRNPPAEIFAAMEQDIPLGMSLIPVNTYDVHQHGAKVNQLAAMLYMTLATAGMAVALVTRPRTSNAAFAVGTVSALVMTFVMFAQTSFMSIQSSVSSAASDDIHVLSALAVADAESREAAKKAVDDRFPQLENIDPDQRAGTLANYVQYKSVFAVPISILIGITISAIFCMAPCTLGTTYAARLLQQKPRWWMWLLQTFEFGWTLTLCCSMVFLVTILGIIPNSTGPFELSIPQQILVYVVFLILLVSIYRQKLRWWWRLPLYVVLFVGPAFLP